MSLPVSGRSGFWNGVLERLGLSRKRFDTLRTPVSMGWGAVSDEVLFGAMSREEALQIPGVARAHHTIVSKGAQLELIADNGSGVDATSQPTFLYRTDLGESPQMRLWCTFDDLYFHGSSVWAIDRGALGQITGAAWLRRDRWTVDPDSNQMFIDNELAKPADYLFFNIPMWDGILHMARRSLQGARDIELAWTARMRAPVSIVELRVTKDAELSQDEVDGYITAWERKHRAGAPAVGMSPPGVTIETHQNAIGSADLFLQARDAMRTDIGSHSSLDGGMVDASGSSSSLTYETQEGIRSDFYEFDFNFWLLPITSRLSLDDVVPRGTQVMARFAPIVAPDRTATRDVREEDTNSTTTTKESNGSTKTTQNELVEEFR